MAESIGFFRRLYRAFSGLLGATPLHPQFFSKRFLRKTIRREAGAVAGLAADLGCGFGPYQSFFRRATYIGFDHPATTSAAQGAAQVYGDLLALPFGDACLDAVLCTQVLEHVPDPTRAMAEIARALKPGGRLLLTAPFFYPLHDEPHDYFRFSPHGLEALLERAGLTPLKTQAQGGYVALSAEFFNLFLVHQVARLLASGAAGRVIGVILALPVLLIAVLVNLVGLALSPLDRERRFVMNYFVLAERSRPAGEEGVS